MGPARRGTGERGQGELTFIISISKPVYGWYWDANAVWESSIARVRVEESRKERM